MLLAKIRRHLGRLAHLLRRPVADQWLVVQAFLLLGHSRFLIKRHGLKGIEPMLGQRFAESSVEVSDDAAAEAARIGWAVSAVAIYTPWTSNCFPQALTTRRLLRRRSVDATVYLGATRDTNCGASSIGPDLAGHAWVRVGKTIVAGGGSHERYTPIVWFSTQGRGAKRLDGKS